MKILWLVKLLDNQLKNDMQKNNNSILVQQEVISTPFDPA